MVAPYATAKEPRREIGTAILIPVTNAIEVRIPIQVGRVFRFEVGRHSGMKPATIPIKDRRLLKA
jgi:hypothetical protein